MLIARRLFLPDHIKAVLWDMDGVLLDTLAMDLDICNRLIIQYFGEDAALSTEYIRAIFPLNIPMFWEEMLKKVAENGHADAPKAHGRIMAEYQDVRLNSAFTVLDGVPEILSDLEARGILRAVVSDNPADEIVRILTCSGINDRFVHVQGNDTPGLKKKPAPDTYLAAARALGIAPENCCVVEDSLRGAKAGKDAGCFVVGVATGGDPVSDLENAGWLDRVYKNFGPSAVSA